MFSNSWYYCDASLELSQAQCLAWEEWSSPTNDHDLVHLPGERATGTGTSVCRWPPPGAETIPASRMEYHYIRLKHASNPTASRFSDKG